MTLSEFRNLDPSTENILLFHTGSTVVAINVSTQTCDGLNVAESLMELENIYLQIDNSLYQVSVSNTIVKSGYYSLVIDPFTVSSTGSISTCTLTYLFPSPTEVGFTNSEYNAVFGNATNIRTAENQIFKVDRRSSLASPSNLNAILSGSAVLAEIQDSNYSQKSFTRVRYEGVKLTSGSIEFDDPALIFIPFQASLHGVSLSYETIVNIPLSDREIVTLYFNPEIPNSPQTVPSVGKPVYEEQGNRFVRLKNIKFFVPDANLLGTVSSGTGTQTAVFTSIQVPPVNESINTFPTGSAPTGSVVYNYDISNYSYISTGFVQYRDNNNNTVNLSIPPDTDISICALTILTSTGVSISQNGVC